MRPPTKLDSHVSFFLLLPLRSLKSTSCHISVTILERHILIAFANVGIHAVSINLVRLPQCPISLNFLDDMISLVFGEKWGSASHFSPVQMLSVNKIALDLFKHTNLSTLRTR